MARTRTLLTGALACAVMIVAAQPALAQSGRLQTTDTAPGGHADYELRNGWYWLRSCDDQVDGERVVTYVTYETHGKLKAGPTSVAKSGSGTCGSAIQFRTDVVAWVDTCLFDKSLWDMRKRLHKPYNRKLFCGEKKFEPSS